jgi:hypothetical protein
MHLALRSSTARESAVFALGMCLLGNTGLKHAKEHKTHEKYSHWETELANY